MDDTRVDAIANALANLGYEGIVAFDRTEPEYDTIRALYDRYESTDHVQLLVTSATTADYQLNGDAQRFWRELEAVALSHGRLEAAQDVRDILGTFMQRKVNARLNQQKRDRLVRLFHSGFDDWFLANHRTVAPAQVWERLADGLDTDPSKKTVVLSMKIYDIARLIEEGEYLAFPHDIPIPCDLQVVRVSQSSGLTESDDTDHVVQTWGVVMGRVSDQLNRPVSLLRIDSIVWQAGQIIGIHEPDSGAARTALVEHFTSVGIGPDPAAELAEQFTVEM